MADDVVPFMPALSDGSIDKETWRAAMAELRPDMPEDEFEEGWAGFVAMKGRVNNPRRRLGGDVVRIGPVLFDPCHYVRGARETED